MSQAAYERLNTNENEIELDDMESQPSQPSQPEQPSQPSQPSQPEQSSPSEQPSQPTDQARSREKIKYMVMLLVYIIFSIFWFYMMYDSIFNCELLTGLENQCTGWADYQNTGKVYFNCATIKFDECAKNNCQTCIESYGGFYQCIEAKFACNQDAAHVANFVFMLIMLALNLVQAGKMYLILRTEFSN